MNAGICRTIIVTITISLFSLTIIHAADLQSTKAEMEKSHTNLLSLTIKAEYAMNSMTFYNSDWLVKRLDNGTAIIRNPLVKTMQEQGVEGAEMTVEYSDNFKLPYSESICQITAVSKGEKKRFEMKVEGDSSVINMTSVYDGKDSFSLKENADLEGNIRKSNGVEATGKHDFSVKHFTPSTVYNLNSAYFSSQYKGKTLEDGTIEISKSDGSNDVKIILSPKENYAVLTSEIFSNGVLVVLRKHKNFVTVGGVSLPGEAIWEYYDSQGNPKSIMTFTDIKYTVISEEQSDPFVLDFPEGTKVKKNVSGMTSLLNE